MSRTTTRISTPAPSTYHLAGQLQARAIDSLYRLTEGHRTMDPIDAHTITAELIVHPWGCSAELRAVDSTEHVAAAAGATATNPLPSTIRSRIRSYQSGTLTWSNTAAPITSAGVDPSPRIIFEATGRHHYHVRRAINPDTYREHWDLTIDGQPCPHRFAGPVGAADFIHLELEPRR
jgi:hypothetical protein